MSLIMIFFKHTYQLLDNMMLCCFYLILYQRNVFTAVQNLRFMFFTLDAIFLWYFIDLIDLQLVLTHAI